MGFDMANKKLSTPEKIIRISLEDEAMKSIISGAYIQLLKKHRYNVSALIRYLDMPGQSFYNKLRQYRINLRGLRKNSYW